MIIRSDEDSIARLMGIPASQIPERVLAEYELRLRMYHCDGNSGALGSIGIIDMLRFLKVANTLKDKPSAPLDWQRLPRDGSIRVMANTPIGDGDRKWASGQFKGVTRMGTLAVLIDGDTWVREFSREHVRIARNGRMTAEAEPERRRSEAPADAPLKEQEPWASMSAAEAVIVEVDDDLVEGKFHAVAGNEIMVIMGDDVTPTPFAPDKVTAMDKKE